MTRTGYRGSGIRFCRIGLQALIHMPVAVAFAAGAAFVHIFAAMAIGHRTEFAADITTVAIFANGREIAISPATPTPFIAAADRSVEAVVICAPRIRAILAIDIPADRIARETTKDHAANRSAAIAMADARAEQPARNRAYHRARRGVLIPALLAIIMTGAVTVGVARPIIVVITRLCRRSGGAGAQSEQRGSQNFS